MHKAIKCIVLDVDGTLTDAGIYYDEHGNELKKFSTKDAAGIFAAQKLGIKIMVLTGRECAATMRRMKELKVDYIYQNVKEKAAFLKEFMKDNGYVAEELGYIGDDLNDLPCMKIVGYVGCPADSCQEVIKIADYVSSVNGGHGAVRDIIEHVLRECGLWDMAVSEVYGIGI